MNEIELAHILSGLDASKSNFLGVYAADELDTVTISSYPAFLIANTSIRKRVGKHWICIWIAETGFCEYFDSTGEEACGNFVHFITGHTNKYLCLQDRIQNYGTDTCGLFCLDYASARIHGVTFTDYVKQFDVCNLDVNDNIVRNRWCVSKNYAASVC